MNKHIVSLPAAAFVVVLGIGAFFVSIQDHAWQLEQDKVLQSAANNQATLVERRLSRSLSAAQTLAAILHTQGQITDFDALAEDLISSVGTITNLQLAPGGIVQKIYPLEGHERALGHNILADDSRKSDAFIAIASRQMSIAGPFPLIQGGIGLIGRQPVFKHADDAQGEKFWGFASVLIMLEDLLRSNELQGLFDQELEYQLWRYDPQSGQRDVIFGPPAPDHGIATATIEMYNLQWQLSVWPAEPVSNPFLPVHIVLILVAAFLAAYLLYFLVRQPVLLSTKVAEKTRLLEIANLQLKENERHLLRQAHHDPLTGLPNRLLFNDRLQRAIIRAEREGVQFALLLIDLDEFKPINDKWGHAAGDQVLVHVGRRLQSCARRSDTVARIGGDEFVMLLTTIADTSNAESLATKIREAITRSFNIPQGRVQLDCSIGAAVYPEHGTEADTLLSHADNAMYRVKNRGRGGFRIYDVKG